MNIHSANILPLFQQYVVSQDAQLSHQYTYVDKVGHRRARIKGTIVIMAK